MGKAPIDEPRVAAPTTSSASVPTNPATTSKQGASKTESFERYLKNALEVFNLVGEEMFLEHYVPAALDRVKSSRGMPFQPQYKQDYIVMQAHREIAKKAC